jgi:hypothetical protein
MTPEWTPEQKRAALHLIDEMRAMGEGPSPDEVIADYDAWALDHPDEARALHERAKKTVDDAIARLRASG